ncbi:ABC transporter substrate-binding protein [Micromonospora sp. MA102]|uniref:ABC transporter substrate-binding protein n=1 Tax=Micromonospora sp. MA102 TaxID=2952755 RepID=UPI0021C97DBD|nr:ABC transporter substrate-binding protein [Micromonospora sp. MA102]
MGHLPLSPPTRRAVLAAVAAGVILACTACSGGAPAATGASSSDPVRGGTMTMVIPADEGCVDPQQNLGRTQLVIGRSLVDSLVFQTPDSQFQPWLAKSWRVSPDGTKYTFHLRDNVTFSDGSKLTAGTVKANFDGIVALGAKARLASTYLVGYQGTTVVDPQTATVTFDKPNAAFLQAVSTPTMGMVADASTTKGQADRCRDGVIGSGPYTLKSYQQNQSQTLVRRTGYAWAPAALHQGEGYLDEVDVNIVPESGVRTGSVVSGQADLMMEVQNADVTTLEKAKVAIETRSNPGLPQQLFVNTKGSVLGDVAVRQALQKGINRQELVSSTLNKYQKVATGALSSTTPGYIDLSSQMGFDQAGAKKLLDDAGWVPGADGIRSKGGQRLTFSLLYGSQLYGFLVPLMSLAQQQLKQIGMDMALRPMPDADANAAWINGDYELRISGLTRADPDALRTGLAGLNPDLDALLTKQMSTSESKARMAIAADAQRLVISQGIAIPINELALPLSHGAAVNGVTFAGDSLLLLDELWKTA